VLLDSVSLVEEDYRRYASEMQFGEWDGVEGGVIEFVKSIGDGRSFLIEASRGRGCTGQTCQGRTCG
jgi:hypothetical protein